MSSYRRRSYHARDNEGRRRSDNHDGVRSQAVPMPRTPGRRAVMDDPLSDEDGPIVGRHSNPLFRAIARRPEELRPRSVPSSSNQQSQPRQVNQRPTAMNGIKNGSKGVDGPILSMWQSFIPLHLEGFGPEDLDFSEEGASTSKEAEETSQSRTVEDVDAERPMEIRSGRRSSNTMDLVRLEMEREDQKSLITRYDEEPEQSIEESSNRNESSMISDRRMKDRVELKRVRDHAEEVQNTRKKVRYDTTPENVELVKKFVEIKREVILPSTSAREEEDQRMAETEEEMEWQDSNNIYDEQENGGMENEGMGALMGYRNPFLQQLAASAAGSSMEQLESPFPTPAIYGLSAAFADIPAPSPVEEYGEDGDSPRILVKAEQDEEQQSHRVHEREIITPELVAGFPPCFDLHRDDSIRPEEFFGVGPRLEAPSTSSESQINRVIKQEPGVEEDQDVVVLAQVFSKDYKLDLQMERERREVKKQQEENEKNARELAEREAEFQRREAEFQRKKDEDEKRKEDKREKDRQRRQRNKEKERRERELREEHQRQKEVQDKAVKAGSLESAMRITNRATGSQLRVDVQAGQGSQIQSQTGVGRLMMNSPHGMIHSPTTGIIPDPIQLQQMKAYAYILAQQQPPQPNRPSSQLPRPQNQPQHHRQPQLQNEPQSHQLQLHHHNQPHSQPHPELLPPQLQNLPQIQPRPRPELQPSQLQNLPQNHPRPRPQPPQFQIQRPELQAPLLHNLLQYQAQHQHQPQALPTALNDNGIGRGLMRMPILPPQQTAAYRQQQTPLPIHPPFNINEASQDLLNMLINQPNQTMRNTPNNTTRR